MCDYKEKEYELIKEEFIKSFDKLIDKSKSKRTVFDTIPFDPPIMKWEKGNRVLRLQEADEGTEINFGYAFGKSGLDFEFDELLLIVIRMDKRAYEISKIYNWWIVEIESEREIENRIIKITNTINASM